MNKLSNMLIMASIITTQYLSGFAFFFLQGIVIHDILKKYPLNHIIYMLGIMIIAKSLMLSSNMILENVKKRIGDSAADKLFKACFPVTIYKDFAHRAGFIFHTLNDNIQKKVTSDISILSNRVTFSCVFLFIYISCSILNFF